MLIRSQDTDCLSPSASEITPRAVWQQRRQLLRLAALAGGASLAPWAGASQTGDRPGKLTALPGSPSTLPGALAMEPLTPHADVTGYNNFYEFGTDKSDPARHAHRMKTRPWTLRIEGLVGKPRSFGIEELLKLGAMEERIYRLRCVEGWSMVIPWVGYSLAGLLRQVEPLGSAKYVEFTTLSDPAIMPGLRAGVLDWPYVEGLRLDEAMHPLTLLAFGLYGEVLPNQNGAPLRLVVPWKYGFKSAKSIVRIRLVEQQPRTSWSLAAPREYGFYSNVNPEVPHPRWSQSSERRLGESGGLFAKRRPTLPFNGYAAQVAQLYAGMDLQRHY
ncbi:protein-methionine-sulfoxide reductase catalytic subunit MsrP [Malikia sp.]|uniref:protein-methionine-sulfoxide reductase catalytic subunit MsrP n=1 Tax=Malikia sp. TaxID=2070706 RepID=UPI002638AFA9|nr:protein-methionine-sulfoxide reductase catalytic subunit MsrP [Malikia sp.]MDD2729224.1 protein-methionine-sulfoxide reductase catalytic subunit MsrP [Malikia sp.]